MHAEFLSTSMAFVVIIVGTMNMLLKIRFLAVSAAVCTYAMKGLAVAHRFFNRKGNEARSQFCQLVALLVCFPIFQASHFFFKVAYLLNQRRLRLLCREDFFLQFYDRRVANGGVADVLHRPDCHLCQVYNCPVA